MNLFSVRDLVVEGTIGKDGKDVAVLLDIYFGDSIIMSDDETNQIINAELRHF